MPLCYLSSGEGVDFVSLLGAGIDQFRITGIDTPPGQDSVLFPIKLDFNNPMGSFAMTPLSLEAADETVATSEPPLPYGLLLLTMIGVGLVWQRS